RGEQRKATDDLWLETFLCSVLRAYSYADDGSGETIRKIMGVRRFNPVTNTESEHRFLSSAEQLFFRGMFPSAVAPIRGSPVSARCCYSSGPHRHYSLATRLRLRRPGPQQ